MLNTEGPVKKQTTASEELVANNLAAFTLQLGSGSERMPRVTLIRV